MMFAGLISNEIFETFAMAVSIFIAPKHYLQRIFSQCLLQ